MNYIKHLTGFFEKVAPDRLLNPTHISLYISLFQFWNYNRFKNPISISRDEVMRISKISSKATYHKCLKALHNQGYIKYEPSYNPFKGSHVFLFNFSDDLKPLSKNDKSASPNFEPIAEQVLNKSQTGSGTSRALVGEQALVPSINNTNITNNQNNSNSLNLGEPEKKIEMPEDLFDEKQRSSSPAFADYSAERTATSQQTEHFVFKNEETATEEKSSAKKEEKEKLFAFAESAENENGRQMPERLRNEEFKSSTPAFADYTAEHTANSRQKEIPEPDTNSPTEEESVEQVRHLFSSLSENDPQTHSPTPLSNPIIEEVLKYFRDQNFPELEANKFFNYFKSIGWLVGGKTPMTDWQAAARNWMLNAPKFISNERTDGTKHLDTSAGKDYSEPL